MLDLSRCFFLGDSPTDPAVIDDRMVRTNQKKKNHSFSMDGILFPTNLAYGSIQEDYIRGSIL